MTLVSGSSRREEISANLQLSLLRVSSVNGAKDRIDTNIIVIEPSVDILILMHHAHDMIITRFVLK